MEKYFSLSGLFPTLQLWLDHGNYFPPLPVLCLLIKALNAKMCSSEAALGPAIVNSKL